MRPALALLLVGCAPAPLELPGFEGVAYVAALELRADGALVRASELRTLGGGATLLSGSGPLVIAGWGALDGAAPTDAPLVAREGCAPALPSPVAAVRLLDGDATASVEPSALPPLSAPWAVDLCPDVELARYAFRARCKDARCPWETRAVGRCGLELELPCLDRRLVGRVDPSGALCLESPPAVEEACRTATVAAPIAGRARCPGCDIDAFLAPEALPLSVERVQVVRAARWVPSDDFTGGLGKLPSLAHYLGFLRDFTVAGDRVVVVGSASGKGGFDFEPHTLWAFSRAELRPLGSAPAGVGTRVIDADGDRVVGVSYGPDGRYLLEAWDRELAPSFSVPLDDRATPGADEPGLSTTLCDVPIELTSHEGRAYVVMARGDNPACGEPRAAAVHVFDAATGAPLLRRSFPSDRPHRAKRVGRSLWIAGIEELTLTELSLPGLEVLGTHAVPPGFARTDTKLFDFMPDAARGELVVATIRDQPAIRRDRGADLFADRSYFLAAERDPTAVWAAPFVGELGLIIGTSDANPEWPTSAALYDRAGFDVLPGELELGYGPPRKLIPDGEGGLFALLGWSGELLRIRPRP